MKKENDVAGLVVREQTIDHADERHRMDMNPLDAICHCSSTHILTWHGMNHLRWLIRDDPIDE